MFYDETAVKSYIINGYLDEKGGVVTREVPTCQFVKKVSETTTLILLLLMAPSIPRGKIFSLPRK